MPPPKRVEQLAEAIGLSAADVEPFGWTRGKLALGLERALADRPRGKYVLVTAVTPTPLGEGKTVTTIGLAMALSRLGLRAIATLREPSRAPLFGLKGGGAGGGKSGLEPAAEINLHLTGDLDRVAHANNLLAAMVDNHLHRGLEPTLDPASITLRRVVDIGDRALAHVRTGLGGERFGPERESGFELTAASEVMAILALARSLTDLRARLGRMIVGFDAHGIPVTAEQIGCAGAMTALLREAIRPNLVQTSEGTPAFVHAGPFANIAHGNSSVIADLAALRLADYVITEAGFGAEAGAEKFAHIKCPASGETPDAAVLVCSVRALKAHSGRYTLRAGKPPPPEIEIEDLAALSDGSVNLEAHLEIVAKLGLPAVVAVNRFPSDSDREVSELIALAEKAGARRAVVSDVFAQGSVGGVALAEAVIAACQEPSAFRTIYQPELPLETKIERLARELYGAAAVDFSDSARESLRRFAELGFERFPVCVAKTQFSISHDAKRLGRPSGYRFPVRAARLSAGAGFVYALAGEISTMPGLPSDPAALDIDVDPDGRVTGLR